MPCVHLVLRPCYVPALRWLLSVKLSNTIHEWWYLSKDPKGISRHLQWENSSTKHLFTRHRSSLRCQECMSSFLDSLLTIVHSFPPPADSLNSFEIASACSMVAISATRYFVSWPDFADKWEWILGQQRLCNWRQRICRALEANDNSRARKDLRYSQVSVWDVWGTQSKSWGPSSPSEMVQ